MRIPCPTSRPRWLAGRSTDVGASTSASRRKTEGAYTFCYGARHRATAGQHAACQSSTLGAGAGRRGRRHRAPTPLAGFAERRCRRRRGVAPALVAEPSSPAPRRTSKPATTHLHQGGEQRAGFRQQRRRFAIGPRFGGERGARPERGIERQSGLPTGPQITNPRTPARLAVKSRARRLRYLKRPRLEARVADRFRRRASC
jgi:hypothetical protein